MTGDWITITKFAELANVSRQTIYTHLDGDLSEFVKTVNGKKSINTNGLQLYLPEYEPAVNDSNATKNDNIIQLLTFQMTELSRQLIVKDCQLTEKDKQIEKLIQLNHQNQILLLEKKESPEPQLPPPEKKSFWDKFKRK